MLAVSEKPAYPHQAAGKVTDAIRAQMTEANDRFGVTDGALVRMALEAFLPGYLAAQGRPENVELISKITAAIHHRPEMKGELEQFLRQRSRPRRPAIAAA